MVLGRVRLEWIQLPPYFPEILGNMGGSLRYVLPGRALPVAPQVFVNYSDFSPVPDEQAMAPETFRDALERSERFWTQLMLIWPTAFVADNPTGLSLVICDGAIFRKVLGALPRSSA